MKSILVEKALGLKRTHSIMELKNTLNNYDIEINISDEECVFLEVYYQIMSQIKNCARKVSLSQREYWNKLRK
ncbi:MAG: hypothetical protein J7K53_13235 [Bacteroidales bacterium]|nr:hypothetical protein [Bacteroidales bacterium]